MPRPVDDVLARMRGDWDRRATEDARFYIASGAARSEEEFRASGERDVADAVLDGIRLASSAAVLEIGCGVGRLLVPLATRAASVRGVDISPAMIERSKAFTAGVPNVTTWVTDGSLAPVPDASLDFVFSYIVFQHVPERAPVRRYVEEAARVLKPGGLFRFQVDGRWRRGRARTASTYDGVKFSPEEVRALLYATGLGVVDEWGAETHYHWVTARAGDGPAGLSVVPRAWDVEVLREALARCGSTDAAADADRVVSGTASLRRALAGAEAGISLKQHADFVRDAFERVFGTGPPRPVFDSLVRLLDARTEVREDVVDILLAGVEARELFRPRAVAVPWPRLAALGLPAGAGIFEAVAAAEELVSNGGTDAAVERAFGAILGHRPDEAARAHYARVVETRPRGRRQLVRALLEAPDAEPPRAPSPGRLAELLSRHGVMPEGAPRAGESFAGEADVAHRILAVGAGTDEAFVRDSYLGILGREADPEGAAWYRARLESGELGRAGLLRELLWSEELRRP